MPVTMQTFANNDRDYVAKLNANFAALAAAVNSLQSAISGGVGPGAQLITDVFDRSGVVGTRSYQVDLDGYAGGALLTIGYRPAPNLAYGELGVSAAWVNTGDAFERVQMATDAVLNFAGIVSGLPKTVYVVLSSSGVPQLVEVDNQPNVLYLYSMTWDGDQIDVASIVRLTPILPGYELIKDIARRPQMIGLFDPETDWVSDEDGMTSVLLPGAVDPVEETFAEMAYEVIGFYLNVTRADEDGFSAPGESVEADDNHVKFKPQSDGADWTDDPFDVDCSNVPDFQFLPVSESIGLDRYVTLARTFELTRVSLGALVNSARAFQWGVLVRPIYGPPFAKDVNFVDQV